jgi:GNAT superfamily N-acetyltransferase
MNTADLAKFSACHEPTLSLDEPRHGLILGALARARAGAPGDLLCWTLGGPGQCAIKTGPHSIVLGTLDESQCRRLAELTAHSDYPGVIGPEDTTVWFTERATQLGLLFLDAEPQQIHSLRDKPRFPKASGHASILTTEDLPLFTDWAAHFCKEAVPHDCPPTAEEIAGFADSGDFLLWIDEGRPVSMAAIRRRLRYSAANGWVYTPPEWRGCGYAGSVTAACVERIYSEGRPTACLYTDLRNPASNRCYAKIGFRPVCRSMHAHRATK